MSDNQDKEPEGARPENSSQKGHLSDAIFSPEETIALVKGFIVAYLRGKVKPDWTSAEDFVNQGKAMGKYITLEEAQKKETEQLATMEKMCAICLGTVNSTKDERQTAINYLAQLIIRLRSTQRLEGTFMDFRVEEKLTELEKRLDTSDEVVRRLIDWFRQGGALP